MNSSTARTATVWVCLSSGLILAACAAGDSQFTAEPAGFFVGLWHGLIACIAFVVGLFYEGVEIYERTNTGAFYDLGFLFGIGLFSGGGHHSHRRWSCRRQTTKTDSKAGHINVDISWTSDEPDDEGVAPGADAS